MRGSCRRSCGSNELQLTSSVGGLGRGTSASFSGPVHKKWFEEPETVQAKVEADRASARASATTATASGAGSLHALAAVVLALVIAVLLVYGLWETAVKASQTFAG